MAWQSDWEKYVKRRTKEFADCGLVFPHTKNPTEIHALAVMDKK